MEYVHFTEKILPPLEPTYDRPLGSHREFGRLAEERVVGLLKRQGWQLHFRNFRSVGSEVDIVCSKGLTLCFVEVKYRKILPNPLTITAVGLTRRKVNSLKVGAKSVLLKKQQLWDFKVKRFDLAVVTDQLKTVHYFSNCYEWIDHG